MGGEELLARLRPNRFALQRLRVPATVSETIRESAERLDELRAAPADAATIVARIPKGLVYFLDRREGEWVFLQVQGGAGGWARLPACPRDCGGFLQGASFAADLLAYMGTGRIPTARPDLSPEALVVRDQLAALDGLNESGRIHESLALTKRWSEHLSGSEASAPRERTTGPTGGSAANAAALAELSGLLMVGFRTSYEKLRDELPDLRQAVKEGRLAAPVGVPNTPESFEPQGRTRLSRLDVGLIYDNATVERTALQDLAFGLVEAALVDPRNPELLSNIAVLFRSAGDDERAAKAQRLADEAIR